MQDQKSFLEQLPFSVEQLIHLAPGTVWRHLASQLGPLLHAWLTQWMACGFIPAEWKTGWVVLLPKPNKPVQKSRDIERPIALQSWSGSTVCVFITLQRNHGSHHKSCVSHVQVQQLTQAWRYDAPQEREAPVHYPELLGGCQLSWTCQGRLMPCRVND